MRDINSIVVNIGFQVLGGINETELRQLDPVVWLEVNNVLCRRLTLRFGRGRLFFYWAVQYRQLLIDVFIQKFNCC